MGRKVHPMAFRIGIIRDWQSKWYDDKHYADFIVEDAKLRKSIQSKYSEAGISLVEIERQANKVGVTIHTARPGIVIGRGGQRVEEMRQYLEGLVGKKIQLDIREIRQPELDAYLVARSIADQMERRVAYRRAMKQSIFRTLQAGAKGMRITCSGRLGGVEIARRQMMHQGRVPLHTLRADIDYGFTEAHTTMGRIGVKVWIYRGDILPELQKSVEAVILENPSVATTETPVQEMIKPVAVTEEVKVVTETVSEVKKPRARKKVAEATIEEIKPAVQDKEADVKPKSRVKKIVKAEEVKEPAKADAVEDKVKTRSTRAKVEPKEVKVKSKKKE
jgi:small subunit ribosomal protein S3